MLGVLLHRSPNLGVERSALYEEQSRQPVQAKAKASKSNPTPLKWAAIRGNRSRKMPRAGVVV